MTMQYKIAARAENLSRRVYASLPFEYRVARLLIQLKVASIADTYGRALYAEFIKAGVTGMPDVGKMPAEELRERFIQKGNQAASLLPIGYGGRFGRGLMALAQKGLGQFRSEDNALELLQSIMTELYGGTQQAIKGVSLASAESYIKKRVMWRAADFRKRIKDQKNVSLTNPQTQLQIDLMDERSLQKFVQLLGPTGEKTLFNAMRYVDPKHPDRAWNWIEAQLQGKSGRDIAEEWGVAPSMVTQWVARYQEAIKDAFQRVMDIAA